MKKRGRALALLLAAVLTVSSVPGTVMAADGVKPQDGTTKEQPFWSGTGGSTRFRIPCLVYEFRRWWTGYDRIPFDRQRKDMALYVC